MHIAKDFFSRLGKKMYIVFKASEKTKSNLNHNTARHGYYLKHTDRRSPKPLTWGAYAWN